MKKLLMLGGSSYIVPLIKKAHELGIYVITCDYLPGNIAHRYSDAYENISIIDKDAVLNMAMKRKIDGVISFACDPGVVTAAYVAEKMGLPFQTSYEVTCMLQNKGLFRDFLRNNGFNVPNSKSYSSIEEAINDIERFEYPVIIKPVDSAGSKGVSRVDVIDDLKKAIIKALESSICGRFIIEDYLELDGYQSSADPFTVNGNFEFLPFSDQRFDENATNEFVPTQIIYPCTMKKQQLNELDSELRRFMKIVGAKTGIYNIEARVCKNGKTYIMEISPRGGGNKIAELQDYAFGTACIENEIRKAVNMDLIPFAPKKNEGCWIGYAIHSVNQEGLLNRIEIDPVIEKKYIKDVAISANKGDKVSTMQGANGELGDLIMYFSSREECDEVISRVDNWLKIILD